LNSCNKINSIEKLNLEKLIDTIWEEYREERYASAIKLSQKGMIIAFKRNDRQWIKMFDALYKEMIDSYQKMDDTEKTERDIDMDMLIKGYQEIKVNYSEH